MSKIYLSLLVCLLIAASGCNNDQDNNASGDQDTSASENGDGGNVSASGEDDPGNTSGTSPITEDEVKEMKVNAATPPSVDKIRVIFRLAPGLDENTPFIKKLLESFGVEKIVRKSFQPGAINFIVIDVPNPDGNGVQLFRNACIPYREIFKIEEDIKQTFGDTNSR
ncbi:MAG: hypothetical protein IIA45_05085 [Bacteroidetes bacterium]|nr:hypothetical protein [Bacteroidota bacterium]